MRIKDEEDKRKEITTKFQAIKNYYFFLFKKIV